MDYYEQSRLAQFEVAHRSTVLLFTKEKFSILGRKLRPELGKLYVSSELRDCTKLLGNTDSEELEVKNNVDLVRFD